MKSINFTIIFIMLIFFNIIKLKAQNPNWKIDEGFEDGVLPTGWVIINDDYDGWSINEDPSHAHTGDYCAIAISNINGNDDWLITSQIAAETGDYLIFYARSWFSTEDIEIMISTTDNNIGSFSLFQTAIGITDVHSRYEYDLSSFNGENIYIAFRWTQNGYAVVLDDVQVGPVFEPEIILPDNFTFEQGDQLIEDFAQYINVFNPEIATLSVTGNVNVVVEIEGLNVTFTSPGWYGTETLTFEIDDGLGKTTASDDVDVIVTGIAEFDVGMLSIESPEQYIFITDEVYPTFTIKNFGTAEITGNILLNCEIRDSLSVLAYSALSGYSGGLAVNATVQLSFSEEWTPEETGIYSVEIWLNLTGDTNPVNDTMLIETQVVEHFGTGGPDAMGYQWIDNYEPDGPEYNWIDISETGESAIMYEPGVTFAGDDNMSPPIPFGFSFPFYGIDRESFYVDTNGEILLTDNTWYNHYPNIGWNYDGNMFNYYTPIPGENSMPALVAVFWDDLHADEGTGDIYFQTFGTEPDRYCVVEWHNLRFDAGTVEDTTLCFEAIFYETGDILFQYKNVELGQTGSVCPHDNGRSSTIGIQNDTYDIGLSYLFELVENQTYLGVDPIGNLIQNETAIKIFNVDNQSPFFTFDGKGNTFDNTPEVKIHITDMSGILYDSLYYNIGNGWQKIAHSNFTEPDLYTYQLPEIPNSTTVDYYFAATDNSDEHYRGTMPEDAPGEYFSFEILPTSEDVKVILVCSGSQDYNNIEFDTYIEAFDSQSITYDIYDWEEYNSYRFTDNYDIIFMYGKSMGHSDEEDTLGLALMEFLDLGTIDNPKNIFTAADDIANNAYSLYSFNLFYRPLVKFYYAYIRGRHIPTGYGGGTDGIGGPSIYDYSDGSILITDESVIGNANQELPTYSNSPDVLEEGDCPEEYQNEVLYPEISSITNFIFEDGPINGQAYAYHDACALSLDNLVYKSFFTSFDLSQFTNDDDVNMIIQEALEWFGYIQTGIEANPISDEQFVTVYPNPNSGIFNIEISNKEIANSSMQIFNIQGQIIYDEKSVLNNRINIQDINSGLYFLRITTDKGIKVTKVIIQ